MASQIQIKATCPEEIQVAIMEEAVLHYPWRVYISTSKGAFYFAFTGKGEAEVLAQLVNQIKEDMTTFLTQPDQPTIVKGK